MMDLIHETQPINIRLKMDGLQYDQADSVNSASNLP